MLDKPCKLWAGSFNSAGYPRGSKNGKVRLIHSWVCEQTHGPRPLGKQASHLCDVKACVEETHIVWETHRENNARKSVAAKAAGGIASREKLRGTGLGYRVRKNTPGKPYLAEARLNGKLHSLGGYATPAEAREAYVNFWRKQGVAA